jgi:hypothetical protein
MVTVQLSIVFHEDHAMNGNWKRLCLILSLTCGVAVACTDGRPADPVGPQVSSVRLGRSVKVDTSQANLVWDDSINVAAPGSPDSWTPAGIRGDGRNRYGTSSTFSEYQGKFCGFVGYLGVDVGSALNAEPDFGYTNSMATACGSPARLYRFYYDGAATPTYSSGPHHTVLNLASLAVGQTMFEEVWFGVQQTGCQRLDYNDSYSPSSSAAVTRLPDIPTAAGPARQWRVSSRGSHRAMCLIPGKGSAAWITNGSHFLPFAFTITEVRPPAGVYP